MLRNPIVLAVPLYFVLMAVEYLYDRRTKSGLYRLHDTMANLACGVYQTVSAALFALLLTGPYAWVYDHLRVTDWFAAHPALAWWIAFVGSDFLYYWFHRWSHESAIGWFSHVVHHQSEDYNLSVALRQDAWQPLFSLWFMLPLAWLGVPPSVFGPAYGVMIVYQFWIHTRAIKTTGPVELLFNTPSHHRVHHAVNTRYLDKNYAGVFILWDKLFGTFEPESERPVYGVIDPLASYSPVWAHLHYGAKLRERVRAADSWWVKLQVLFRGPGWRAPGEPVGDAETSQTRLDQALYEVTTSVPVRRYAIAAFVLAHLPTFAALAPPEQLGWGARFAMGTMAFWLFANVGGLIEGRWWAVLSQQIFLGLAALVSLVFAVLQDPLWLGVTAVSVAMLVWLRKLPSVR